MLNYLGTYKVPFIISLLLYPLLSSPDYRIRLISPLDLGHFMVHLSLSSSPSLSLAIYKEHCYLHVLHSQTGNSGRPNIEALSSLCKPNNSQPFLNPLFLIRNPNSTCFNYYMAGMHLYIIPF